MAGTGFCVLEPGQEMVLLCCVGCEGEEAKWGLPHASLSVWSLISSSQWLYALGSIPLVGSPGSFCGSSAVGPHRVTLASQKQTKEFCKTCSTQRQRLRGAGEAGEVGGMGLLCGWQTPTRG